VGASTTWTIPTNLLDAWPNHTQVLFRVWTRTLQGSTRIGVDQPSDLTVRVPASGVPTVTAINAADQNPDVASIVGRFVQGLSRARLTVSGAGAFGSTIKSATATLQGTTVNSGGSIEVNGSGNLTVTGRVTDSRGRTGSSTAILAVLAYQPPKVNSVQVRRSSASGVVSDNGTSLRVDLNAAVQSLVNGSQRNSLTITVRTRPYGGSAWTTRNVINHSALTYNSNFVVSGGANYPVDASFDVEIRVADKFITSVSQVAVATSEIFMHWDAAGLGIMKYRENGALDVGGDIFMSGILGSGSVPWARIPDAPVTALPTDKPASDNPSTYPQGISFHSVGNASAGYPASIGTVMTVRHSAFRQFQQFYDRSANPRVYYRSSNGDSSWQAWQESLSDASIARGRVMLSSSGIATITLPLGLFGSTPIISATPTGNGLVGQAHISNPSSSSFELRFYTLAGAQAAGTVDWVAFQSP